MKTTTENGARTPGTLARRILEGHSSAGNRFFSRLLAWLESPTRLKHTDRERLLRGAGDLAGRTVLEIGCGSGFFTVPAAKLIGGEGTLYAADIQPLAVETTEKRVREAGLSNVIVQRDDAMRSAFADSTFDAVLLYGVLPAPFIDARTLFAEIRRVLKPNGVCAVWTAAPLWRPYRSGKRAGLERLQVKNGVFRLRKPETAQDTERARD